MTIAARLGRWLRGAGAPAPTPVAAVPAERWADQWIDGASQSEWLRERSLPGRLYADIADERVEALRLRFPARVERLLEAAERLLRHEFNLLGSGPYTPIDPDRPMRDGYTPIDWALDPVSGLRFPVGFPHSAWTPAMRPGLADIKLPWEIGRCQHWVALGQAFRLTGLEKYAAEIVRQHEDFLEANPIGTGVQYTCTMDVAIRAVNWALAFELIRRARAFDGSARERGYRSLFELGVFIEGHLENKYEVTSNHFLSNVAGLYALAVIFADRPAGRRWLTECRDWIEQEMRVQVLPDGADYESSIPYHRLVTELFLAGARLAQLEGRPLSAGYLSSLRRMLEFLAAVLRPDGLLPQVGDADDGRLHIFSDYGGWDPQDARHVLAPGAFVLGETASPWLALAGETGAWEAAWWGFDTSSIAFDGIVTPERARLFDHAGVVVARSKAAYLLVTNGRVGTNGFGNHKHNDLLAFEYHDRDVALFVDPGSYVYTSNPEARNAFRGTAAHNTVMVDGLEQNDLKPEYLFRLFETSTVEHVAFHDAPGYVEYVGRHTGYSRLPSPVVHERCFRLDRTGATLTVIDRLTGAGRHALAWHFCLAPGVHVERADTCRFSLSVGDLRWWFTTPAGLSATIADAWYSPAYGVRVACRAIDLTVDADVSPGASYTFTVAREAQA